MQRISSRQLSIRRARNAGSPHRRQSGYPRGPGSGPPPGRGRWRWSRRPYRACPRRRRSRTGRGSPPPRPPSPPGRVGCRRRSRREFPPRDPCSGQPASGHRRPADGSARHGRGLEDSAYDRRRTEQRVANRDSRQLADGYSRLRDRRRLEDASAHGAVVENDLSDSCHGAIAEIHVPAGRAFPSGNWGESGHAWPHPRRRRGCGSSRSCSRSCSRRRKRYGRRARSERRGETLSPAPRLRRRPSLETTGGKEREGSVGSCRSSVRDGFAGAWIQHAGSVSVAEPGKTGFHRDRRNERSTELAVKARAKKRLRIILSKGRRRPDSAGGNGAASGRRNRPRETRWRNRAPRSRAGATGDRARRTWPVQASAGRAWTGQASLPRPPSGRASAGERRAGSDRDSLSYVGRFRSTKYNGNLLP